MIESGRIRPDVNGRLETLRVEPWIPDLSRQVFDRDGLCRPFEAGVESLAREVEMASSRLVEGDNCVVRCRDSPRIPDIRGIDPLQLSTPEYVLPSIPLEATASHDLLSAAPQVLREFRAWHDQACQQSSSSVQDERVEELMMKSWDALYCDARSSNSKSRGSGCSVANRRPVCIWVANRSSLANQGMGLKSTETVPGRAGIECIEATLNPLWADLMSSPDSNAAEMATSAVASQWRTVLDSLDSWFDPGRRYLLPKGPHTIRSEYAEEKKKEEELVVGSYRRPIHCRSAASSGGIVRCLKPRIQLLMRISIRHAAQEDYCYSTPFVTMR